MEIPEDMKVELLSRLPSKSITKFKCVSKEWNNLISGSVFRRCYRSRRHNRSSLGFVYHPIIPVENSLDYEPAKFVCTSNIYKSEFGLCHDFQKFGEVVNSSKGLLLLFHRYDTTYYVYDLLTRNHVMLPKASEDYYDLVTGFICKENNKTDNSCYLTYKVIRIGTGCRFYEKASDYPVDTYSSETGKWCKSTMTTASPWCFFDPQRTATVIEGVLYWYNATHIITAYNPDDPAGHATLIQVPKSNSFIRVTISSTQNGCLLYMVETRCSHDIDVWFLGKKHERGSYLDEDLIECSRWTLFHKISNMELTQSLLAFRPAGPTSYEFVGFHARDSNIIHLRITDEFLSYNLKAKRVEAILSKGKQVESLIYVDSYIHLEWPSWPCLH